MKKKIKKAISMVLTVVLLSLNYSPLYGESGSKSQSYCV